MRATEKNRGDKVFKFGQEICHCGNTFPFFVYYRNGPEAFRAGVFAFQFRKWENSKTLAFPSYRTEHRHLGLMNRFISKSILRFNCLTHVITEEI